MRWSESHKSKCSLALSSQVSYTCYTKSEAAQYVAIDLPFYVPSFGSAMVIANKA